MSSQPCCSSEDKFLQEAVGSISLFAVFLVSKGWVFGLSRNHTKIRRLQISAIGRMNGLIYNVNLYTCAARVLSNFHFPSPLENNKVYVCDCSFRATRIRDSSHRELVANVTKNPAIWWHFFVKVNELSQSEQSINPQVSSNLQKFTTRSFQFSPWCAFERGQMKFAPCAGKALMNKMYSKRKSWKEHVSPTLKPHWLAFCYEILGPW